MFLPPENNDNNNNETRDIMLMFRRVDTYRYKISRQLPKNKHDKFDEYVSMLLFLCIHVNKYLEEPNEKRCNLTTKQTFAVHYNNMRGCCQRPHTLFTWTTIFPQLFQSCAFFCSALQTISRKRAEYFRLPPFFVRYFISFIDRAEHVQNV